MPASVIQVTSVWRSPRWVRFARPWSAATPSQFVASRTVAVVREPPSGPTSSQSSGSLSVTGLFRIGLGGGGGGTRRTAHPLGLRRHRPTLARDCLPGDGDDVLAEVHIADLEAGCLERTRGQQWHERHEVAIRLVHCPALSGKLLGRRRLSDHVRPR